MQPARGVDDDDVVADGPGLGQRALGARDRIHFAGRVVHPHARLLRHDRQLLDRRRAPHVGRDDDRVAPCFASHFASLPVVVVLPEPCSPSIKITRGRALVSQPALGIAEQREQLIANDLDDLLRRIQALLDLDIHRADRARDRRTP